MQQTNQKPKAGEITTRGINFLEDTLKDIEICEKTLKNIDAKQKIKPYAEKIYHEIKVFIDYF